MNSDTFACPNCGRELSQGDVACDECGARYGRNRSFLIGAIALTCLAIGLWQDTAIGSLVALMAAGFSFKAWLARSWLIKADE